MNSSSKRKAITAVVVAAGCLMAGGVVQAADPKVSLVIKNHQFDPTEIKVPANQRVKLNVHNQDSTPEEFESHSLNREKLIPPGGKVVIFVGPLKPDRYDFFGDFNPATAKGVLVAE